MWLSNVTTFVAPRLYLKTMFPKYNHSDQALDRSWLLNDSGGYFLAWGLESEWSLLVTKGRF